MTREIKFRAWNGRAIILSDDWPNLSGFFGTRSSDEVIMQFTGLKDKNGVAEVYEGDIIDGEGNIKGNIYESPQIYQEGVDCLIEGMGTNAWRNTESVAMGRGCKYAQ